MTDRQAPFTAFPVSITLHGIGRLEPHKDITPYECICLTMLLCVATHAAIGNQKVDYASFIHEHGLQRHFVKAEP